MDRNLHTDDFIRLLREKSDEFRMYPSKQIWYSVYNNIHPARKWPSVVMSITLISALLLVGYLNTKQPSQFSAKQHKVEQGLQERQAMSYASQPFPDYTITDQNKVDGSGGSPFTKNNSNSKPADKQANVPATPLLKIPSQNQGEILSAIVPTEVSKDEATGHSDKAGKPAELQAADNPTIFTNAPASVFNENELRIFESNPGTLVIDKKISAATNTIKYVDAREDLKITSTKSLPVEPGHSANEKNNLTSPGKSVISAEEKAWIDNYAMYNRPAPKKWKGKLAWQLYATPSVVYRSLTHDPNFGSSLNSAPLVITNNNRDINTAVVQKPSIGLEIGAGFKYPIFKGVKIKSGLQVNYTRYNSHAFHNTHPMATKLTMHDYESNSTYELYRTTPYSNRTGLDAVKLHNETVQISIPVGIDMKLIGNENLQWNVGVTMQPTFVIGGKSYLLSSDRRNYVQESSMLNRWNLNAGFETFVSFKSNGLTWQIGPQLRSQLFSTNTKNFAIEERLVNYGIKFGISKTIK